MSRSEPFISIVTATFNSGDKIGALEASLVAQRFQDFQWVVQDGGSTDGTIEQLARSELHDVSIVSKPDAGIYDAFNEALERATGQYVLFIGSDDFLVKETVLEELFKAVQAAQEAPSLVLGKVQIGEHRGFTSRVNRMMSVTNGVHHQGALYERAIFRDFRYDLTVPIIADYELNFILSRRKVSVLKTDILMTYCGQDGISNTTNEMVLYRGMHKLRSKHIGFLPSYFFYLLGTANVIRRRVVPRKSSND